MSSIILLNGGRSDDFVEKSSVMIKFYRNQLDGAWGDEKIEQVYDLIIYHSQEDVII